MNKTTLLKRTLTRLGDVAAARPNDPSQRILRVGNLIAGIRLYPKGGRMVGTVQSSIVEFRASLVVDGVEIPLEAELEDIYMATTDEVEEWESVFANAPFAKRHG